MQYEFLKQFPKRMKHVGMYGILMQNSAAKQTWKQYGFMTLDEQINVIFAMMLYIMEQSLKEERCTIDDIGAYLDYINSTYFYKPMSYDDCKDLGDFIINVILSNEGKAMYFEGYDFEQRQYKTMHISYVANEIIYTGSDIKRTSYKLTDDGYNLLLSTLEIENNMKLTIHEMIFKMHLERQSYDKAADEIKNVFNLIRKQVQKNQEAMLRVRRNALNYSVEDYGELLNDNLNTIDSTKQKLIGYRETVERNLAELEEKNINVSQLTKEEEANLENLKIIDSYLNRGIDEYQKVLNSHFDLKILYEHELEMLAQMSLIQRFPLRTEVYDKVLNDVEILENIDIFLRPLFHQSPSKIYNLNKSMELQRPIRKKKIDETDEVLDFGDDKWQEEMLERRRIKLLKYENSLVFLLNKALENKGDITLLEISNYFSNIEDESDKEKFIPNTDIFKEIMVELIKARDIHIADLRNEKKEFITEQTSDFQLNEMLLKLLDENENLRGISDITIKRTDDLTPVEFHSILNEKGEYKTIRCSNVEISVTV